jgi:hypothetical protein
MAGSDRAIYAPPAGGEQPWVRAGHDGERLYGSAKMRIAGAQTLNPAGRRLLFQSDILISTDYITISIYIHLWSSLAQERMNKQPASTG